MTDSRLPRIRVRPSALERVRRRLESSALPTVCESALCPNRPECYAGGHLTVLILGESCTRSCRFCAVRHGQPPAPDPEEPLRVAALAEELGMRHVVVTSVTRDDLPDGGSAHYARVAEALAALPSPPTSEALVPDFLGDGAAIGTVAEAPYVVLAHNVETVPRLYPAARPHADYGRSLGVLSAFKRAAPAKMVKSGLMLGLGETAEELRAVFGQLAAAGVGALALGQYLRPTPAQLPVARFLVQEEFEAAAAQAREAGVAWVTAGPLVRSSYRAGEAPFHLTGAPLPAIFGHSPHR